MKSTYLKPLMAGAVVALAGGALTAQAAVTNFSKDVGTSIDLGLAWQNAAGAYTGSASYATGLSLLALLEKRVDGTDPDSVTQGYNSASAADKARMDSAVAYILSIIPNGHYAYGDGASMMALSVYLLTGGPNAAVPAAINTLFDRTIDAQNLSGYWCYYKDWGCDDSSTTQLVVAGLAAVRGVYSSAAYSDPARLATLNAATAKARAGYVANGLAGEYCSAGLILTATERGHGYNVGSCNSPQQTASGTWIQLVGGADLNDPSIQGYLEWARNRYRYTNTLGSDADGWPSYWYYLWSSSKAYAFLEDSGVKPNAGNLAPSDIGTLPAAAAPAFAARQVHIDCTTVPRVALFGAGPAGYYCDPNEPPRVYFDYALTILTHQAGSGQYVDANGTSRWNDYSAQAYALLVLQRSVGGGCIDTDGDGLCDDVDNCPAVANPGQEDKDGDKVGNLCDNCPDVANPRQEDSNGDGRGDACSVAKCDLDGNGAISKSELATISAARGTVVGQGDPRDADNDGKITLLDVKACIKLSARP